MHVKAFPALVSHRATAGTVPFRIVRPPRDFFEILKNLRNSEKSRKKRIRAQKKVSVMRDGRTFRNGTV